MTNVFEAGSLLIDRYEVTRYINAGGMQEVYSCFDHTLQRDVVLKTPKSGVKDKRFKRGAEMSARINHHNIAATLDYYEDDQLTIMIEELIPGKDLGQRLDHEFNYLDPSLTAHVIHNISRALHEAHRSGICHRDLKPSNIMTSDDPSISTIKLTDFGIAKLAENEIEVEMMDFERDQSTLTSSNTLLGAVPYMAPECWADWRLAGQPMDVWALGCIAYQLITGNLPFGAGRNAIANVLRAEQTGQVTLEKPSLFGTNPANSTLEGQIWQLIINCLRIDPTTRPDAADILAACGQWCYASNLRRTGTIETYGERYAFGKSKTGYIRDDLTDDRYFYHLSEYYGEGLPIIGQSVNVTVYPGSPRSRAAPVLPLR